MKVRQGVVLGSVVGLLGIAAAGASAIAAVPIPDANGIIRACVKYEDIGHYEQMRWITKTTCPRGEKLISWNAEGPKGDKGDKGDKGEPGTAGSNGISGYEVVPATKDLDANTEAFVEATCSEGKRPLGGGFNNGSGDVIVLDDAPMFSASHQAIGWIVHAFNQSHYSRTINAYAICATVS